MKVVEKVHEKFEALLVAINRYPLTAAFLVALVIADAIGIQKDTEAYLLYSYTFLFGVFVASVVQQLYERFFEQVKERILLMVVAGIATGVYYLFIRNDDLFAVETMTKTGVMMLALLFTFIWTPSIKSDLSFHGSFLATVKALFIAALFTAVITVGVSLIIVAVDQLLYTLPSKTTPHALNIIGVLFAPIFFLSLMPFYFGKKDRHLDQQEREIRQQKIQIAVHCPRNLEVLISYIIIPLTAIYTIILGVYVLINIGGDFWSKNLLEPLLVGYAITGIIVYILASQLANRFALLFLKVFPKVLVPIVMLQLIASIMKIQQMGITHGRYYVILFAVFAMTAGMIFIFLSVRKQGVIAAVLIILAILSIVPPIDAFTVSKHNQIHLLENVLRKNKMLVQNEIVPNADISIEDKRKITKTVQYIASMDYDKDLDWLPDNLLYTESFEHTFGFAEEYEDVDLKGSKGQSIYLDWGASPIADIENYDRMIHVYVNSPKSGAKLQDDVSFEKDGHTYTLSQVEEDGNVVLVLTNEKDEELLRIITKDVLKTILDKNVPKANNSYKTLSVKDATAFEETKTIRAKMIVNGIDYYDGQYNGDLYLFIDFK